MSEERDLLVATVRDLVAKHASSEATRAAIASPRGYDEKLWSLLCEQVGVAALVVPEELGGADGTLADAAAVLGELARTLVPTPLLGTTLAQLALLSTPEPDADTIEGLATGAVLGTVAFDPEFVIGGDTADLVLGVSDGALARWDYCTVEPLTPMDPTRRLARVTPGSRTALGDDPGLADTAALLMAAEQVGAAARCLELTVAYTAERVQFGRPIGSFQALKHRMADLYVLVQTADAVVSGAIDDDSRPLATRAALARVTATEALQTVAGEAIQLHGGIAITWEHDMHLYFKRAHGSAMLLGGPAEQLRQLESEVFSRA